MLYVLTASADTYITNKIVDGLTTVSGNVGRAGTVDIFKLYNEAESLTGSIELSRGLIKFDLSPLMALTSSILDVTKMKATLKMKSLSVGQPTPTDYTLSLFPLSSSFSEGFGRDVVSFSDIDASNFLSSSIGTLWNVTGANSSGDVGSSSIDYVTRVDYRDGLGLTSTETKQYFSTGLEDLSVDVSRIVSASLVGLLPNKGLRLSFTSSEETDSVTRFVKRFASRHVRNVALAPRLEVAFDDSIVDYHSSSLFDVSGTLYLFNNVNGSSANLVSGSSLTQLTGQNVLVLRLTTGSLSKYYTGSQEVIGGALTGTYKVPLILLSNDTSIISGTTTVASALAASGQLTFEEVWTSFDRTVVYRSGSLTVKRNVPSLSFTDTPRLVTRCYGPSSVDTLSSFHVRVKVFDAGSTSRASKFFVERQPIQVVTGYHRLRDVNTGELIYDFDKTGTRMSLDSVGNYVSVHPMSLPIGRPLRLEFQIAYGGATLVAADDSYIITRTK